MELFKQLRINIAFADVIEQMPAYAKFLKDIVTHKRKIEDCSTITLSEVCSAIIQRKLPPKLKDPGSFTVPCAIGEFSFDKALCDLGASINLMPYSIFQRLGISEVKPTRVTLQMADRSIKHPRGIIEDILVKVDKFIFPADFVVLDMEEDRDIPIILGRPFLATGGALIDVRKGELKLRVNDEEVTFNVFKAMKYPKASDDIFRVDVCEAAIHDHSFRSEEPLEVCLLNNSDFTNAFVTCAALEYANHMNGFEANTRRYFEDLEESKR